MKISKKIISIFILVFFIILVSLIIFITMSNDKRKICLYDYRTTYSDIYSITSKDDVATIDKIISKMNIIHSSDSRVNSMDDFKVDFTKELTGGCILIEIKVGDSITCYRIQGTNVTKGIYKKSYENLISNTFFILDDYSYQLLVDICEKYRQVVNTN